MPTGGNPVAENVAIPEWMRRGGDKNKGGRRDEDNTKNRYNNSSSFSSSDRLISSISPRENYREHTKSLQKYFGQQLLQIDTIYQQYKERHAAQRELHQLTEREYQDKLNELLKSKKTRQDAANLYFLQQQNAAFLHTPYGSEIYQKRQTRRVAEPELVIEQEQDKLRQSQLNLAQQDYASGDSGSGLSALQSPEGGSPTTGNTSPSIGNGDSHGGLTDLVGQRPDVVKNQLVDRGRKYFDSFDTDRLAGGMDSSYPSKPVSFTDFVDIKTRMSLGTTMYGSVVQSPAVHQYHAALDPSPLPPEAPPPHFANYNTMHPDRLGYFITYYDAYRLKQPPQTPFREYKIERPDFFQLMSFYPTWTLDGNYVWTPTKDPFEQAKDPSRADLFGIKFARFKLYYLYYFIYGLMRPSVVLYTTTGLLGGRHLLNHVGDLAPDWSQQVEMSGEYSLALNTYVPVLPL